MIQYELFFLFLKKRVVRYIFLQEANYKNFINVVGVFFAL